MAGDFVDGDLDATEIAETWQDWQPDPVDADPSRLGLIVSLGYFQFTLLILLP